MNNWVGVSRYIYILIVIYLLQSPPQEMGVPQGSLLSISLFSMLSNSITQCLKPGIDC